MAGPVDEHPTPGGDCSAVWGRQLPTSILVSALAVFLAGDAHANPSAPRCVELNARVPDATFPQLVRVADTDDVIALWTGSDHLTWAQRVGFDGGLRGAAERAGQVTSGGEQLARDPLAVALSNGDLALIGVLADGRIALARGSKVAARRVAPQVLIPAGKDPVVGLAADAVDGGGLAVLVLRSSAETLKGTMSVALHAFDAAMKPVRKPLEWSADNAFAPRLSVCRGVHHIVWQALKGVVAFTIDTAGARSAPASIDGLPGTPSAFGPILCTGDGAYLLTSWTPKNSTTVAPKVALAALAAGELKAPASWRVAALPGEPRTTLVSEGMLEAFAGRQGIQILVDGKAGINIVELDSKTLRATPRAQFVSKGVCIPDATGQRTVCGGSQPDRSKPECRDRQSIPQLFLPGAEASVGSATPAGTEPFWSAGQIAGVNESRPSDAGSARLVCGQRDWSQLRAALERWCAEQAKTAAKRDALQPYCSTEQPASLLYQATHCTDQPVSCGITRRTKVPSVSQDEIKTGRVELRYAKCSVWFRTGSPTWTVDDHECSGED